MKPLNRPLSLLLVLLLSACTSINSSRSKRLPAAAEQSADEEYRSGRTIPICPG
jgi:hypothetical protein